MPSIWKRKPRASSSPTKDHSAVLVSFFPPAVISLTRVITRKSNITRRRRAYATLPQVHVEPLYLSENDLTADRMLAIMGCDNMEVIRSFFNLRRVSHCAPDDAPVHAFRASDYP